MKHIRLLFAFLFAACIALPAISASAQTPQTSAIPNLNEFEGLEAAVSRTYGLDVEGMLAATPDLAPEDYGKGLVGLSAMVLKFDSAENASAGMAAFQEGIGADVLNLAQDGTPTVTDEPVSDLGDQASATTLHTVTGEDETFFRFVLVQQGEYFILTSALGSTEDLVSTADALAATMLNEGSEEGSEAIFVAEGGSRGGLWGFMPAEGDEVLAGMIAIHDETLFPAP